MPTWTPSLQKGYTSYTYTWKDYEIRPTKRERTDDYLVYYAGQPLDGKPRCLRRSRRVAERHAMLANPDTSGW